MITPMDLVLGGLVPLVAAALAFTAAWFATRRAGAAFSAAVAWSAGVIVGYAAGALGLNARGPDGVDWAAFTSAAARLVRPVESQDWLPMIALAAAVPALAAALSRRGWVEWLLAAPLCLAAPARLLWSKYRASQQLRDAGFADNAITPMGAALVLATIAAATLVAWIHWRRAEDESLPKTRSLLAIVALVGAATVVALTRPRGPSARRQAPNLRAARRCCLPPACSPRPSAIQTSSLGRPRRSPLRLFSRSPGSLGYHAFALSPKARFAVRSVSCRSRW
jgi:hypothetical protein